MTEIKWLEMFSDNLYSLLLESNMSQRELADLSGLSEATISNYLNSRQMPGVKAIINIANALECSTDDLIYFEYMNIR